MIEAVFTSEQFTSVADLLEGKLAITTIALDHSLVPTLQVNPILTTNDTIRLLRFVSREGLNHTFDLSQELEKQLRVYLKDDEAVYVLQNKIENLLNQELLSAILVGQDEEQSIF